MAAIYWRGKIAWGRVQRQGREIRQSLKTSSRAVAEKRLKAWVDELDRVSWGEKARCTFDDLALRFIAEHLPLLRPKSAARYATSIDALTDTFEGMYLDQIGGTSLAEFERARRRGGRRISEKHRGVRRPQPIQPATIRRDLACLSSMFGFAIEVEVIDANPVPAYLKRGKKRGLREAPPRRRYLSADEERLLLGASRDKWAEPDLYDAIALAIDTGLRRDELLGLERDRVSLERNEIRLTEGTKNAKPRNVPLLPRAAALLAQRPAHFSTRYVFVNKATGARYRHINRGLAGAAKRAGIEPLTWHDLRRTCGCRLLQDRGLSMEQVSRWLGHSSVTVTEKSYSFLEDEHLQRAIGVTQKPAHGAPDNA